MRLRLAHADCNFCYGWGTYFRLVVFGRLRRWLRLRLPLCLDATSILAIGYQNILNQQLQIFNFISFLGSILKCHNFGFADDGSSIDGSSQSLSNGQGSIGTDSLIHVAIQFGSFLSFACISKSILGLYKFPRATTQCPQSRHLHKLQMESLPPDINAKIFIYYIKYQTMEGDLQNTNELSNYDKYIYDSNSLTQATGVVIAIHARESRGSGLKKYTAYLIRGSDRNGNFQVWRRFNQFMEMRNVMVKYWPGVLIPSLPSKNLLMKNEEQINQKRQRYLNDFLKKMTLRQYLYYSEQFQLLIRSQQSNLSDTYNKMPSPSPQSIVSKYKEYFGLLAGKEITTNTYNQIVEFNKHLENNQKRLVEFRKVAKEMAFLRDRYNKYYLEFFKTASKYEENIMTNYTHQDNLIYTNPNNQFFGIQQMELEKALQKNPYWLIYDLIKNEERDGKAFSQLLSSIEQYAEKGKVVQGQIDSNVKGISQSGEGKKGIKTIGKKGTAEEIKYELEVENQNLMKYKESIQTLRDIIIALVCFVEIENYKKEKKQFYKYTLNKLTKYDENVSQVAIKVWEDLQSSVETLVEKSL